jgi:hypothetical protein
MEEGYSSSNRKRISRPTLEHLREQLLQPLRTNPPTIGTYPRAIDVELFRLFSGRDVSVIRREKSVTLGGREVRRKHEEWVYETHRSNITYPDEDGLFRSEPVTFGEVQEDGSFLPIPELAEVPHYTSNTDDALMLALQVLGQRRRLLIEETGQEWESLWRAKLIDSSYQIVGEGETYECAASVVLAILSDLIANDGASFWIDVINKKIEPAAKSP